MTSWAGAGSALDAPAPVGQPRFSGFDGLRALAATLIVLHHSGFATGATYTHWFGSFLGRMDIGVPIFFVISGFLLYRPFVAAAFAGREAPDRLAFWWRRALRIYPAYWSALVVQLVLGGIVVGGTVGFLWDAGLLNVYDLGTPVRSVTGITQSWSLATELMFYAVLPSWASWAHRRWRRLPNNRFALRLLAGLAGWAVVSLAFRIVVHVADPAWGGNSWLWFPALAELFALGMGVAVLSVWAEHSPIVARGRDAIASHIGWCWLLAAFLFWVVSTQLDLPFGLDRGPFSHELARQVLYGLVGVLLVAPVALAPAGRGAIRRILGSRVANTLGILSYGIYIWHQFFIAKVMSWFGWPTFGGHFVPTFVLAYALSVGAAYVSYRAIERPIARLRGAVRGRRAPTVRTDPAADRSWYGTAPVAGTTGGQNGNRPEPAPVAAPSRPLEGRRFRRALAGVGVLGLAVRVAYVLVARRGVELTGDPYWYHATANLLADGNGFISPFSLSRGLRVESAEHPPLFALYLAAFSFVGITSATGHELAACLLGTATVIGVGVLGARVAGARVGLIAALAFAVYPNAFTYDGQLLSESLTMLLVVVILLAALRVLERRRAVDVAVLGAVVALAALTRAEQLLFVPILVVPIVLGVRSSWRQALAWLALAGCAGAVVLAPWLAYNRTRFAEPVLLSSQGDVTLAVANCDDTYDGPLLGYWQMQCAVGVAEQHGFDQLATDQSTLAHLYRTQAVDYVRANASRVPVVALARLGRALGVFRPVQQLRLDEFAEGRERANVVVGYGMFVVLVPLAIIGAAALRRRRTELLILLAPVAVALVTVTAVYASTRFRAPAEVSLCVLGAVGVDRVIGLVSALRREERPALSEGELVPG